MSTTSTTPDPEIRELIEGLKDFHTRRVARLRLVELGEPAIDPLIGLLRGGNEALTWCAVTSLGELKATRAVPALIEVLARGTMASEVADALAQITGHDLGADAERWRRWAETGSTAEAPTSLEPAELMNRVVTGSHMTVGGEYPEFQVTVRLEGAGSRLVFVRFGRRDPQGQELVDVLADCGPADPRLYEQALRQNLEIPEAAYAITDIGSQPTMVLATAYLCSHLTEDRLRESLSNVATHAETLVPARKES